MLEEFNMSALKSSPTLRWERRETDEKEMPASEQRVYLTACWKIVVDGSSRPALRDGESLIKPWTCK